MRNTLILGILLIFALSVQVSSRNHPAISTPETETISAAQTQSAKPVIPNKQTSKAKTVKPPQLSDWEAAVNDMLNAAKKMEEQCHVVDRAVNTLEQSAAFMNNVAMKNWLEQIKGSSPRPKIEELIVVVERCKQFMKQEISAGRLK